MKKPLLFAASAILVLMLAGCGGSKNNNAEPASAQAGKVTKIVVGTGTQFPQVCFIDENGKLTGFDVELIREIDKRLDDYEFDIQTLEFTNLLLSLETKKIDLVAHEMEKNPEREEKYLFNKEPYAHWRNKIVVAKDNNSVQSLDDLKGKKVLTTATSAQSTILENYNKENDNAIEIVYQNGGANDSVQQVTSGRVDAFLAADFTLSLVDTKKELKLTGPALSEADILFMFRKNDPDQQKLADRVDEAIRELKADGTIASLSSEWLGNDFTSEE
ncbi:transporter substrate-binding domain-containing protein [Paenibacillus harenae]|uniref:transporter substrate-binding domain-containing protein n=1 Tax=Paenibacillus harenae TaxID=306543 RepID=UPI0027902E22|nr:transporter substrate-binding domain-containing protein [Paenibacillus harenae]MDQ0058637.1 L-cystine transport system substrate-binding protein [Paenibacillus harenae]